MLRAYGWRAVRGEDAQDRRVLINARATRRIVVSRRSEDGRWQWWDVAVGIVGDIVDAVRQLMRFELLRDIVGLLRRALEDPPGPLPVATAQDEDATLDHTEALPVTGQLHPSEEPHHDHPLHPADPEQTTADVLLEEPVGIDENPINEDAEAAISEQAEQQNNGDAEIAKRAVPKPSKGGRGR